MKVFVAGATGVLGRRLVRQFTARGHEVMGLSRNPENAKLIRSLGGDPRHGDLFDADSLARLAAGADVVIHAATAMPVKTRTKPEDWAMNHRIRTDGAKALTSAARKVGAKQFLAQSVVWVALTSSTRTSNARIKRDLGWQPTFPTYREGVEQVAAAWKDEGFPPKG